jgi:hypothetical protein
MLHFVIIWTVHFFQEINKEVLFCSVFLKFFGFSPGSFRRDHICVECTGSQPRAGPCPVLWSLDGERCGGLGEKSR